ncbi:DUF2197 domain-containing protein [Bacillus cereus]|uniref:DUF2197 domain-containing protein n=1 Tax=Bacillus cereus TaxID=1396 RepID=A0A2A8LUP5_BACCE|nr:MULTISPECIES: DUF2197 domain-containing protein [Bacillus cereus group]MDR4984549.1 DUF2197 domain-containing protein [Bacillus cereus]MEA1010979.1 DUF2197 domain-containing protein [Bacillus cereus]PES98104.1 DUF2197 domain-containing protein [Bacillus cereus]PFP82504.1 DUF2197 domain-containing protein [Bacillus cereus]PGT20421.1 DUF2197 domain-containing protein [Bacillus cereus]
MHMMFYEIVCLSSKNIFRVYEGSEEYKRFKEKPKGIYCCDECSHKIQLEMIKHFLDSYIFSFGKV